MAEVRPYRLTLLLHPQSTRGEREAVTALVDTWVRDRGGKVQSVTTGEERKLSYPIAHQQETVAIEAAFSAPPADLADLRTRLAREKRILRARLFAGSAPSGKRLRDLPQPTRGAPQGAKATMKAPKEKVPLEKLGEKIEEILKEEVL